MSDIKLFQTNGSTLTALGSSSAALERSLQILFEENLDTLLGVRFLASEYTTTHGGRIDTLGIDENNSPVIIEYKRTRDENVVNQGLFYLDWLVDHQGDFEILVRDRFGREVADQIEWGTPRLICIAADFTKYDTHAVKQISRNIDLVRYRKFDNNLLLLELLTAVSVAPQAIPATDSASDVARNSKQRTVLEALEDAGDDLKNLYSDIDTFMKGLGSDVTLKTTRYYFAFRRIKNFACVEFKSTIDEIHVYLKIDPSNVELEEGFARDVRKVGHHSTGDLQVILKSRDDFERAKPLIIQSYEAS